MITINEINIFISSPNDLGEERTHCRKVIERINTVVKRKYGIGCSYYIWTDDHAAHGPGNAQQQLASPKDYDLYIGFMGARCGTPTRNIDRWGNEYYSGTDQEFCEAYEAWKASNQTKPVIKFFRKKVAMPEKPSKANKTKSYREQKEEFDQYQMVEKFFERMGTGGSHPFLYDEYTDSTDFFELAYLSILDAVLDIIKNNDDSTQLSSHYLTAGVTDLYLYKDNDARNKAKGQDLKDTTSIRMIAHSGNSYLNSSYGRYYDDVKKCLERGGTVDIILANPYSQMGYFITLGDDDNTDLPSLADRIFSQETPIDDIIENTQNTQWTTIKQNAALLGYRRLKKIYPERINLKISSIELDSTILLTDNAAYHEPYLHCVGSEQGMNAFELRIKPQMDDRNNFYKQLNEYFNFLWLVSEDYFDYDKNKDLHKAALKTHMHALLDPLKPKDEN